MASSLEAAFEKACEQGIMAGAVLLAAVKDKGIVYSKSFGQRSLAKDSEPLLIDDMMQLFSCSKLVTTIAALQLVERGLFGLDQDVSTILPELAALKVLSGMNDGQPVFEEQKTPITLRQLLSHSSGVTYALLSPLIVKYNKSQGLPSQMPFRTVTESFSTPLVYQPGTSWKYSPGVDWAGLLISRLTGISLEEYTQKYIASPLKIGDMTYFVNDNPSLKSRMAATVIRDPSVPDGMGNVVPNDGPEILNEMREELGGAGLCTSMPSYIKVLYSLLANDEKILKKETVTMMFEPQLMPASQKALQAYFDHIPKGASGPAPPLIGEFPQAKYDWGLGGMLSMDDIDAGSLAWRRKRFFSWGGLANLFWFIDRQAGLCGVFGTQVIPNGDEQVRKMIILFEKEMYRRLPFWSKTIHPNL
ncbi:hypothetical protein FQN55_007147 [Onygenales sp. PD_40]|nr:hypothetical protein FQN55_007147 [Onygenales sp. PD_40]